MMRSRPVLLAGCGLMLLTAQGCAGYASPQRQAAATCRFLGPSTALGLIGGALGGAALGAASGSGKGAAIGAGAGLLIGLIGGLVKDDADCQQAKRALAAMGNAPVGQTVSWHDDGTGANISLVATGEAFERNGEMCRPVTRTATGPAGSDSAEALTCRTAEGDYHVVQPGASG